MFQTVLVVTEGPSNGGVPFFGQPTFAANFRCPILLWPIFPSNLFRPFFDPPIQSCPTFVGLRVRQQSVQLLGVRKAAQNNNLFFIQKLIKARILNSCSIYFLFKIVISRRNKLDR